MTSIVLLLSAASFLLNIVLAIGWLVEANGKLLLYSIVAGVVAFLSFFFIWAGIFSAPDENDWRLLNSVSVLLTVVIVVSTALAVGWSPKRRPK
jgi:hypothetical protein